MSISVTSKYYNGFPLPTDLYSPETQKELTKAISCLFSTYNKSIPASVEQEDSCKTFVCELDYSSGLVNIKSSKNKFLLDMLNIKFIFTTLFPYLRHLNGNELQGLSDLKKKFESIICYKEAEKISQIYFSSLKKYIDNYEFRAPLGINPVKKFSEHLLCSDGVKGFRYLKPPCLLFTSPTIADTIALPDRKKCSFTKFIEKLPESILAFRKNSKKIITSFIQNGLDIRDGYENKILFLKQIFFFILFKQFLVSMFSQKLETSNSHTQKEFLNYGLTKCCFSDLLAMIPLACRMSNSEDFSKNISLFVSEELINEGIEKANLTYKNFIKMFSQNYNFTLEELGENVKDPSLEQTKINQFIKGLSSLAISGGVLSRPAFYEYCLKSGEDLSENIPLEIILGITDGYFHKDFSFEESHLGYFLKILNVLPKEELKDIQTAIHTIGNYINQLPVEEFLKKNKKGQYLLRHKGLESLGEYYLKGQDELKAVFTFFQEKTF